VIIDMAGIILLVMAVALIVALAVAGTIGRRRAAGPGRFTLTALVIWVVVAGVGLLVLFGWLLFMLRGLHGPM
jgi:hypothetical protein